MGFELPEADQFSQAAIALLQQGTQLLDPKIRNRLYEARLQALRSQKSLVGFSGNVVLPLLLAVMAVTP